MVSIGELTASLGLDTSGFSSAFDGISGRLGRFGGMVAPVGLAAGAALAGTFVAGLNYNMNLDKATDKISASLGLSAEESGRMGDVAGGLYSNAYGENMDDVGAAIESVVRDVDGMRGASNEAIESMTGKAMSLAQIMEVDVGEATTAAGQLMKTGLAKNGVEAFDLIAAAQTKGLNRSGDLLDTITEYSGQFQKLGLGGPMAMGLISQAMQAGARDTDFVADALKEFSIRAIDGSKLTAEGFAAIGLNAQDMGAKIAAGGTTAEQALGLTLEKLKSIEDPVARNAAAVALFGTKAEDLGEALFAMDTTTAVAALGNVGGAAAEADAQLNDNLGVKVETLKRKFEEFAGKIVEKIMPAITGFVDFLTNNEWVFWVIIGVLGVLTLAFIAMGIAAAISWALALGPILVFIAIFMVVVAAIIAAVILIKIHWETIKNATISAWNWIKDTIVGAWNAVWNAVKTAVQWVVGAVVGAWNWVKEKTSEAWNWVKDKISGVWNWLVQNIGQRVLDIINKFVELKNGIVDKATAAINFVKEIPGKILAAFGNAGRMLWDIGRKIMGGLADGIQAGIGWIKDKVSGIAGKIIGWKGPPAYDKKMLTPQGEMIIDGLVRGFDNGIPGVEKSLRGLSASIPIQMSRTPMGSPGSMPGSSSSSTTLIFSGPIYSDSQGLKRLANEVGPLVQQKFSKKSKQNAGNVGF
jgi:phage-related minor tail protein